MTTSYIVDYYRVPASVKDFVFKLTEKYSLETHHFFVHVLFSSLHSIRKTDGWAAVSSELIKKRWGKGKVAWELLETDGLLELKAITCPDGKAREYSRSLNLSREFRVTAAVLNDILAAYPQKTKDFTSCIYYNLCTGKKMIAFKRHKLTNETGHPIPELVRRSIESIKRCIINEHELESFFSSTYGNCIRGNGTDREMRRYLNDFNCVNRLRGTGIKEIGGGLIEYYPSYKIQPSGRITEQGGGMQSITREGKAAAFMGISGLRNYDLKSSQVWGLIQWFEMANLDDSWLRKYLKKNKQEYANAVGISKDCWKRCFLALIMGGKSTGEQEIEALEEATNDEEFKAAIARKITEYLLEEAKNNLNVMLVYLGSFQTVTAPITTELEKWHDWLIDRYVPMVSYFVKNQQYVNNKTGATFCISDYKTKAGKWKNKAMLKRRLAAFWLQGNEAAFIHHLSWVSENYGYEVINNQHDGLVVIGQIPEEAVEYARQQSGLKYASLEEKDFI